MEWGQLGFSALAVYTVLFVVGMGVSLLSSALQCGKVGWGSSVKYGAISGLFPTGVYTLAAGFQTVRNPFARTIQYFGVSDQDNAAVIGVGYLTLLAFCISIVSNIAKTESEVCQPSTSEMTSFKNKLLTELHNKQIKEEKNAEKK
jgi:20S proteasome alpha/beta subunit